MDPIKYLLNNEFQIKEEFKNNDFITQFYEELKEEELYQFQYLQIISAFLEESYQVELFDKYEPILNIYDTNFKHYLFCCLLQRKHSKKEFYIMLNKFISSIDFNDINLLYLSDVDEEFSMLLKCGCKMVNELLDMEVEDLNLNGFKKNKIDILLKYGINVNNCTKYHCRTEKAIRVLNYLISCGLVLDHYSIYKLYNNNFVVDNEIKQAALDGNLKYFKETKLKNIEVINVIHFMIQNLTKLDNLSDNNILLISDIELCIDYIEKKYNVITSYNDIDKFYENVNLSKYI